jgi:hypothetical protein
VHQPFRMDPAVGVVVEAELAGAVRDDHGVRQEAVGLYASSERTLGGNFDGIRVNLDLADAESVEMV